jgi:hypothetical protein
MFMAYMGFRPYPGPDATKIVHLPEAGTSGEFMIGDLVIFSGGSITIAAADTDLFGIAMADHTGVTGTSIPVYVITPEDKFIAQSSAATLETYKGNAYNVDVSTAGSMCVDCGTTGDASFYVEQLDPRDGVQTSAGGRVIGRFVVGSMDAIGG